KDKANGEMKEIVVCVRDLKAEEVLKDDMLKTIQVPASAVPAGSINSLKDAEGRWVRIAMLADEPIIEGKLAPKNAPKGLVGQIPQGMRAIAIEVNEKTGVSGFILPEHRVDVIRAKNI